jgi:NitT/TauT family transport system substrate-binding protein
MAARDPLRFGWTRALLAAAMLFLAGPAAAETALRFSLEGRLEGPNAAFLVAQDKGYYQQEGLDVLIDEAASALEPITRVASGTHELAIADINTLIRYRDQQPSAPVKAIFMVYNDAPFAVVARKSRGITEPKQLEGKRIGAPLAGSTFSEWPLFAKLNAIDTAKVKLDQVGTPVRAPMLAAGELDAALGYGFRIYIDLKNRGVSLDDILLMRMSDYGLKLYGSAIIVNTKFAAERPGAVGGFVRAVLKGLKDAVRNPAAAVESVVKREDGSKQIELERLRMANRDNIVTPEVRSIGFGAIDPARFEEAIDQIALVYPFKNRPKTDDIFDPSFLPPAAERRVN